MLLNYLVWNLKPSQNKKGRKNLQLHRFLNTFSQLPAVKKYSKNSAAEKIFGPPYFDPALAAFFFYFVFPAIFSAKTKI